MLRITTPPASSTDPPADASYAAGWRRTLLVSLPFGVLAFVIGALLDGPSGQGTAFDSVVYPTMATVLVGLWCLLARGKRHLPFVVLTIIAGTSVFLVSKLVYLLFFGLEAGHVLAELTESFFWIPVIYLLSFILPGFEAGRRVATVFTFVVMAVSLAYALAPWPGTASLSVVHALIQLNLANTVLLGLTRAFIGFKEAYTRTQTRMETAERFANLDALTGLANRFALQKALEAMLERARSDGRLVALLFIDLDGFKTFNDTLGHEAGDALLTQFAQRLKRLVRRDDMVARISGDEFVIALSGLEDPQTAAFVAHKLHAELIAPFHVGDQAFVVTASIGVSVYPNDADDSDALLRHADAAMYRVKRSGKNGHQFYRRETDAQLERQRALERDLRSAIQAEALSVVYQPLHDLHTGEVRTFEALLRWEHPELGHVPPTDFIPVAEQSGLIVPLGRWVLHETCRQAKAWQRLTSQPFRVSVNVSPLQFAQPAFYPSVVEALETHQLMPDMLQLELTEGIVLHGVDHVTSTLDRLQRLGVRIAIDDFGTGYSSLAYLRDLPIDSVKIDRSFVKDLGTPRKGPQFALALVEAITSLASHLDLEVVAEGIETKAQCELLTSLGCSTGQGFYFAQPMTAAEAETYLRHPPRGTSSHPASTLSN
jgi:diguanylate cyclase